MLGHKLRRLRQDQGLTQAALAERLAISPSYLNLIERNQRQVTIDLLLKLGRLFDIDIQAFAEDDAARLSTELGEVFGDALFEGADIRRQDLIDVAEASPAIAEAVTRLYRAYREARAAPDVSYASEGADTHGTAAALDAVREFLQGATNHFPALEAEAESLAADAGLAGRASMPVLASYLEQLYGMRVRIMPTDVMGSILRRYDPHGRRILLNESLTVPSRLFQALAQVALIHHRALIDRLLDEGRLAGEAADVGRLALAHYFAGAVLMPYDAFLRAATAARYDVTVLTRRFDTSFEQVCHRLTTLNRSGARGVPFFFLRVDGSGSVSKQFSAGPIQFSRFGGTCPLWVVHDAFRTPGQLRTQLAELPDGARVLAVSMVKTDPSQPGRPPSAILIGCDIAHAAQLVYADGLDPADEDGATPIGIQCRVCERLDCPARAQVPAKHRLVVDPHQRGQSAVDYAPHETVRVDGTIR